MIPTSKTSPGPGAVPKGEAPPAAAAAPQPGARTFESQADLDAAVLGELFWPASLAASLREGLGKKAAAKIVYEKYLAAAGAPTDPVERMLLEEVWLAHHQVADLHVQAAKATNAEVTRIYSAAAVRLMGEVRRTALALRLYRLPPGKKSFTVVGQQNIATGGGTQDVQYVEGGKDQATLHPRDKVGDKLAPEGDLHELRERIARGKEPEAGGGRADKRAAPPTVVA